LPGWTCRERREAVVDNRPAQPAGPGRQVLWQPKHAPDEPRAEVAVDRDEPRTPQRGCKLDEGPEETLSAACPSGTPLFLTFDTIGRRRRVRLTARM
jgi:hypothetical protein